ncbi:protein unc-13 homolog D-like [Ixodes scapularis]|uniref:protein unc-13 homolog D-like n=1 Tax=Ixodes scapularis TaxID=6945 RepID=UPI001C384300|nr:protein unc-13 homolog D-like [Ixodes scapularis]
MSKISVPENQHSKSAKDEALDAELGQIFETISTQDFFWLCVECLLLSERDIGKPTKPYVAIKQEMKNYVRTAFKEIFQSTNEEKLLEAAGKSPEVRVDLHVTLVQAEDLVAKDVSGMSDPFCVLRVGSSQAQHSSVKHKTVNPCWNEAFQIRIEDPANDAFCIEVWDKDPRTLCGVCRELYDVRSCASCLVFLREFLEVVCYRSADDFMGSAVKTISEIPCTGGEMCLLLKDKRRQGAYGKIYLKLGFKCQCTNPPNAWAVLKSHYCLSLVFLLQHATAVHPDIALSWCEWDECLSEEGLTLLFRHALSKGIVEIEQCFCRITALTNVSRSNKVRVNFSVLYQLLARMKWLLVDAHHELVSKALETVLKALSKMCPANFSGLHEKFSLEKEHQRMDLSGLLFCCVTIEALSAIEITDPASTVVRGEAALWYESLVNREDLRSEDFSSLCQCLGNVLSTIQAYHEEADKIFKSAWNETYSQIVRKELDFFLSSTFKPGLRKFCSELQDGTKETETGYSAKIEMSLRAFYRLHDFHRTLNKMLPVEREKLELDTIEEWFGSETVMLWFDFAKVPVSGWISESVSKDDMSPLARDIKYGTAVRDTLDIFTTRYVQLWEELQFRDFRCALAFATCVGEGGLQFSKCLAHRISAERYFDAVGEFQISRQLCVAISSLTSMSFFLQNTLAQLELFLSRDSGLAPNANQIVSCLELALDETLAIVTRVCSEAADKLKPELCASLSQVANASSECIQEKKLYLLQHYLDTRIRMLDEHLEAVAFRMILRLLWKCALMAVRAEAASVQEDYLCRITTASLSYVGLHHALLKMKSAFDAGGQGLPVEDINTKLYLELEAQLTNIVDALGSGGADSST